MKLNPESFAELIVGTIKKALDGPQVSGRIAQLEARIKELEGRPELKYSGVWRSDQLYAEGHLTTHKGGLWLAVHTTNFEPGTEASGFRLIVKSGGAR
jgi:hypothetical protein